MQSLNILVVEDDAIVAEDIRQCLSIMGHQVLGPAYHVEGAKELLQTTKPQLALLDINLSSAEDGINLATWIKTYFPLPIIFLTAYADKFTLERAKAVHPEYYLLKPFNSNQLKVAIEIAGFNYYEADNENLHAFKMQRFISQLNDALTCRETDVIKLLEQGMNNREIAENLYLSEHTVKSHLKNIFLKADVKSRAELISKINHI